MGAVTPPPTPDAEFGRMHPLDWAMGPCEEWWPHPSRGLAERWEHRSQVQGLEAKPTGGTPQALPGLSHCDIVAYRDLGQVTECNRGLSWTLNGA